jgi:hypothetical protein
MQALHTISVRFQPFRLRRLTRLFITAKALGLTISREMQMRADELIE